MNFKDYHVGIISPYKETRMILPHILNLLGCKYFAFYKDFYDALKEVKQQPLLLFADIPISQEEIKVYFDRLKKIKLIVLEDMKDHYACTVGDCLEEIEKLKRSYITIKNSVNAKDKLSMINAEESARPFDIFSLVQKKTFTFSLDSFNYVTTQKPLTMNNILQCLKHHSLDLSLLSSKNEEKNQKNSKIFYGLSLA